MSKIEVRVDRELCLGARQCSFVTPEVFSHETDGTAVVGDPRAAPLERVLEAARICPNFAITVIADGEVLHEGA